RQFFTQAILTPGFNNKSIEWTNKLWKELEDRWLLLKKDNDDIKIDLESWIHRFTHDMIAVVTTGERAYSMESYFDTVSDVKLEHPPALLDDAERFVKGIRQHMAYTGIAIGVPDVIRRYVPMARSGAKRFSDNKDYLFGKINKLVKRRRREIEDTPLDQPLESHD